MALSPFPTLCRNMEGEECCMSSQNKRFVFFPTAQTLEACPQTSNTTQPALTVPFLLFAKLYP